MTRRANEAAAASTNARLLSLYCTASSRTSVAPCRATASACVAVATLASSCSTSSFFLRSVRSIRPSARGGGSGTVASVTSGGTPPP